VELKDYRETHAPSDKEEADLPEKAGPNRGVDVHKFAATAHTKKSKPA
jgi:hypothetical protein